MNILENNKDLSGSPKGRIGARRAGRMSLFLFLPADRGPK